MIVAMQEMADETQIQQVIEHLVKIGFEVHRSTGARQTVLGAWGGSGLFRSSAIWNCWRGYRKSIASVRPISLPGKVFVRKEQSSSWRMKLRLAGTKCGDWLGRARWNRGSSFLPRGSGRKARGASGCAAELLSRGVLAYFVSGHGEDALN